MTTPVLPDYAAPFKPVPNVTPFTIRDGVTMLKKIDYINKYIDRVLIPWINENYAELADEFETQVNSLLMQVNAALTVQSGNVTEQLLEQDAEVTAQLASNLSTVTTAIDNLTTYVDNAVNAIITDGIQVQDPVVSGILADTDSLSRVTVDSIVDDKVAPVAIPGNNAAIQVAGLKVYNYKKLSRFREKLNRASTELVRIVVLGDSITEGVGSDDTSDQSSTDGLILMRERAWSVILRKLMVRRFNSGPVAHNLMLLASRAGWVADGFTAQRSGTIAPYGSFGSNMSGLSLGTGNTSFTIPSDRAGRFTAYEIFYWGTDAGVTNGRRPGVKIDGVDSIPIDGTILSGNLLSTAVSGLSDAAHSIEVHSTGSAAMYPAYIETRFGNTGVVVNRIAVAGARSYDAVGLGTGQVITGTGIQRNIDSAVMKGHSHLVIIALGTNDQGSQYPLASYKTNLQTLITSALAGNADVLLVGEPPAASGSTTPITEDQYRAIMLELSNENDHVAYVDSRPVFGDRALALTNGLFPAAGTVHPSRLGHERMAEAIFQVINKPAISSIN